jgi:TolB protein
MSKRAAAVIIGAALAAAGAAYATPPAVNGPIAFRRFPSEPQQTGVTLFLINPDGSGERQVTHPPAGTTDEASPSFAPDGSNLIFTRDESKTESLWRVNADGTGEVRLTQAPRIAHPEGLQANQGSYDGRYSPNGRVIAFVRANPPYRRFANGVARSQSLDIMAADDTGTRRVVKLGYKADISDVTWSPDGKRIAYTESLLGRKFLYALFVVSARRGRPHRISPWRNGDINLDWSPNGKLLLLHPLPPNAENGGDYYTLRPDGSGMRRLTHFGPKSLTGYARWSPDGKSIVFANGGVAGQDDIYVMRANGTGIRPVTRTPAWDSGPSWGPAH